MDVVLSMNRYLVPFSVTGAHIIWMWLKEYSCSLEFFFNIFLFFLVFVQCENIFSTYVLVLSVHFDKTPSFILPISNNENSRCSQIEKKK